MQPKSVLGSALTYLADTIRGMRGPHFELCQFRDASGGRDNVTGGGFSPQACVSQKSG
ncbi:hypothetical protein MPLA_830002 [Mesorhizobium sp. ORS 3359]|nr:hypothetical protein MPLA_830002 [Mesorhizobium sp. ORS 3359]